MQAAGKSGLPPASAAGTRPGIAAFASLRHGAGPMPNAAAVSSDKAGRFRAVLFVLVFFYFWIGLAPFPNPNDAGLLTAYGSSSDQLNQIIVVTMSLTVFAALLHHPARDVVLRSYGPLLAIFIWLVLTAFFSDSPATAFRRIVYSALVCLCASAVLLLPRNSAQFAKLMTLCLTATLGLSYFGIAVLPYRAIHQATDSLEAALAGDWRGHFGHKNVAAAAMVCSVFFGLYIAKRGSFWLGVLITIGASVFVLKSGGKTSAAMLPVILAAGWLFERLGGLRMPLVVLGVGALNFVLMSATVSPDTRSLLASIGVDPTFTDRTSIWELALSTAERSPLVGYGFQSFWQMDALVHGSKSQDTWAVTADNAHNGYLDQVINGGLPLLLLIVLWLIVLPCYHAGLALKRGQEPELTRLFIRIWLFCLFFACLENPFFGNSGPIWFTMLMAVFGLRYQAFASPAKALSNLGVEPASPYRATT